MSAPLTETSLMGDERRAVRFQMLSKMKMSWGGPDLAAGPQAVWGLNISDRGAAFVSDQPLPVRASIHLELPNSRSTASGTVRNCMRWGASWRVGVEFDAEFSKVA
jgi:PilZ domain